MQLRLKRSIHQGDVEEPKTTHKELLKLSRKDYAILTVEERNVLEENETQVSLIMRNRERDSLKKSRLLEFEGDIFTVMQQCEQLATALMNSEHAVVYTGAGISTSADIPDYRGTDGVWNKLQHGRKVSLQKSLIEAQPTMAHMYLRELFERGLVKHIVSQNCDGLHIRSGIPQHGLSEIHGNMFIEICGNCDKLNYRIFDVTTKTSLRHHKTERACRHCGNFLRDTIVHFGEKSGLKIPHNWEGALTNAEKADMIICLGSSLKVLRSYKKLWMMDRPKHKRPVLYIVNLQWTPKDSQAVVKIHSRVDFVMETVAKLLNITVPSYSREEDPLYSLATPCDHGNVTMIIPQKFCEKFGQKESTNAICPSVDHFERKPLDLKSEIKIKTEISSSNVRGSSTSPLSSHDPLRSSPASTNPTKCEAAVPAWFGKGVKSKLAVSRRKRRKVV